MLVPDGPAVAYSVGAAADLLQRLNMLPPPLVLVHLGSRSRRLPILSPQRWALPTASGPCSDPARPRNAPLRSGGGAPTGAYSRRYVGC